MSQSVPDILDLSKAWRRAVWSASSMTIAIKCGTARVSSRASIRVVTFVQFRPRSAADTIRSLKSPFKFGENRNADVAWRSAACTPLLVVFAIQSRLRKHCERVSECIDSATTFVQYRCAQAADIVRSLKPLVQFGEQMFRMVRGDVSRMAPSGGVRHPVAAWTRGGAG